MKSLLLVYRSNAWYKQEENVWVWLTLLIRSWETLLWAKGRKHWQSPPCSRTIENTVDVCIDVRCGLSFARGGWWQGNINVIILRWPVRSISGTCIRSDCGGWGLFGFRFHCDVGGQGGVSRFHGGAGSLVCVIRSAGWFLLGYGCCSFPGRIQRTGYRAVCACIWLVHLCLNNSMRNTQIHN